MARKITFEFSDKDLERLDKLREAGYKFHQVMLVDKHGHDRYVDVWIPGHEYMTIADGEAK